MASHVLHPASLRPIGATSVTYRGLAASSENLHVQHRRNDEKHREKESSREKKKRRKKKILRKKLPTCTEFLFPFTRKRYLAYRSETSYNSDSFLSPIYIFLLRFISMIFFLYGISFYSYASVLSALSFLYDFPFIRIYVFFLLFFFSLSFFRGDGQGRFFSFFISPVRSRYSLAPFFGCLNLTLLSRTFVGELFTSLRA